jgi:hypothetical protein
MQFCCAAYVAYWHSSSNRCNAQIRELSKVQRTCREIVGRVDPTLLTHLGNGVCIAASIAMLILAEAHLVLATIRKAVQWRDYELAP